MESRLDDVTENDFLGAVKEINIFIPSEKTIYEEDGVSWVVVAKKSDGFVLHIFVIDMCTQPLCYVKLNQAIGIEKIAYEFYRIFQLAKSRL